MLVSHLPEPITNNNNELNVKPQQNVDSGVEKKGVKMLQRFVFTPAGFFICYWLIPQSCLEVGEDANEAAHRSWDASWNYYYY